jgi:type I restriction enzyme S subunit
MKRLAEVGEVIKGKKPPRFAAKHSETTVPYLEAAFLRAQTAPRFISLSDTDSLVLADETDTLILWDGANAGDIFRGQYGVVASTMARVRSVTSQLLPDFLFYCITLSSPRLRETAAGSTVPHVRGKVVDELPIPLPPLPVQERIVQILQKADEIRRKRKEALELADSIIAAAFINMFGDPQNNADLFDRVPLGELADVRSGVTKGRKLQGKETVEVPYLRVANVQDGFLDLDEIKTIRVLRDDTVKYRLEDGDILMTEGGDPDKLGRGAIWRGQIDGCIHQNHVFRVRTDRTRILPEYLAALLRTQYAKHYFLSCAKRSSNLASVNSTQVKAFPVPNPSIALQRKFVAAVNQWDAAVERLTHALHECLRTCRSLQHRAFAGELTAEWEAANAEEIAAQQALHERLPRLLLLALLVEKARRANRAVAEVLVTALMKYAFLLQMEGNGGRRRLYHFVPYHYGPFAKELYTHLQALQQEGLVRVDNDSEEDKTKITLVDSTRADEALAALPDELKEDAAAIIETYGNLDHNALLKTVYEKYPAYAKKSRLRRARGAGQPPRSRGRMG